jgi:transposase
MKIKNPASCEIRSVIKFLIARNVRLAEIYRQVCEVHGENVMSDGMVRRWCRMFSEGRTNVNDDRSGRPSLVTADLLDQVNDKIQENRRFTMYEIFSGTTIQQ